MQFHTTNSIRNKNFDLLCGLLFISAFLILAACDQTFEPLKENNVYNFTISGYLDASADTQWVRVGRVRESIDEPPNPEGIRVTLEDLQNGETGVMNDSVFTSKNVLNYWTAMDIEHEQTYRVAVERDGKTSEVTLTTPKELPSIYITVNNSPPVGTNIYIIDDNIEHVADLQSVWYVNLKSGTEIYRRTFRFPLRNTLTYTYAYFGAYYAFSNWEEQQEEIVQNIGNSDIVSIYRQFFVALAGPEWNESYSSVDDLEYFLDGTASNVESGLGYVVGIISGWFRQRACVAADSSKSVPCEPEKPLW